MRGLAVVAALTLCMASDVSAEPPHAAEIDRARQLFLKGKAHFQLSEYAPALEAFIEANRLVPQSALLYNIAQAHRALGQLDSSLRAYRAYLDATPASDSDRPAVELVVRELAAKIADRDRAVTGTAERLELGTSLTNGEPTRLMQRRAEARRAHALTWAGGSVGIAGLALVFGGAWPLVDGRDARGALEDSARMQLAYDPALGDRMERGELIGGVVTGVGGAVTAIGAAMLGAGLTRRRALLRRGAVE